MITYLLFIMILKIVGWLVSPLTLFDDVSLPSSISLSISQVGFYFGLIWSVAPYTLVALFASFLVLIGVETKIFGYKFIKWIYNKLPGVN